MFGCITKLYNSDSRYGDSLVKPMRLCNARWRILYNRLDRRFNLCNICSVATQAFLLLCVTICAYPVGIVGMTTKSFSRIPLPPQPAPPPPRASGPPLVLPTHSLEYLQSDEVPNEFLCPINREIMEDPVGMDDGRCYERDAIQEWYDRGHRTSPMIPSITISNPSSINTNELMQYLIKNFLAKRAQARSQGAPPNPT